MLTNTSLKLIWLKIVQSRYNFYLNLQPVMKGLHLQSLSFLTKTVPFYLIMILSYLKEHTLTNFQQLIDIIVYDVPGKHMRFSCVYLLLNNVHNCRISIDIKTNEVLPINTTTILYQSANWLEREAWDLFGIYFRNHPDLRRILTDYGFSGHPLRKDFPLTGFYEMRYNDNRGHIVPQPVELAQELRIFTVENPWINSNRMTRKMNHI